MQFFFADDSTQKSCREGMGKIVAFGGVLVDSKNLRRLSQNIDEIATRHGIPSGEEIKWSPRKGTWIYENLKDEARLSCYRSILEAANSAGCKAVIAICDYEMRNLKPEWGFERCVTYALERVSTYLAQTSEESVIIADRPSGGHKEADDFLAAFSDHLASERNHMLDKTFAMTMLTAPSDMVRHLQLADLVVSVTAAMFAGQTKWASRYFDLVRSTLLSNTLGYIGGTGVKVYPDELTNLYYWVLGEKEFSKVGKNAAWPLPMPNYCFHATDGT